MSLQQIKQTIVKILKQYGIEERKKVHQIWETNFPQAVKHTRLAGIVKGKLIIIVDSPAWKQQINLTKKEIINKINKKLKTEIIKEIEISLGEIGDIKQENQS